MASFWGPTHKLPKTVRFPKVPHKEFNSARPSSIFRFLAFGASFPFILALWAFIPLFWPFGLSFPFIVAFWAFIPFIFAFWWLASGVPPTFGLSFPFIVAFWAFIPFIFAFWWLASGVPPTSCQKRLVFPRSHIKNLTAPGRAPFSDFWPLGLHFLLFWPCGPSFLAVWLCGPSFSFILAFWAFISFHFGLFGLHFLYFGLLVASLWGPP